MQDKIVVRLMTKSLSEKEVLHFSANLEFLRGLRFGHLYSYPLFSCRLNFFNCHTAFPRWYFKALLSENVVPLLMMLVYILNTFDHFREIKIPKK